LASKSSSLQQRTHAAGIVEELPLQLCRQCIPLHDKRGAEASQNVLFFVCEGDVVSPVLLGTAHAALIIICEPLFIIHEHRELSLEFLKTAPLL
jgi:hypothetical protein